MKILDINSFIKESSMAVERTVKESINITDAAVRCRWDGVHWYYYDREGKGTYEDFKSLSEHRNVDFNMTFRFDFNTTDENSHELDNCSVNIEADLHYYELKDNDYSIEIRNVTGTDSLFELLTAYETEEENFRKLISDAWYEYDIDTDIADEMEDRMGLKDTDDLIEEIKNAVIQAILEKLI